MREIEEYKPSARELVFCLTSEFQWLELLRNNGKAYEPVLDYLIDLGKHYEQDDDNDESKRYQSKTISAVTGINSSKIKKILVEIYNDIFELNNSNPELFNNGEKYLYELCFSHFSNFGYFYLWLPVMLKPFDRFDFHFVYAKLKTSSFWVEDVSHRHEYGKTIVDVSLKGGYPNKYRELLLERAKFMEDISYFELRDLSEFQLDEKLMKYARQVKL